MQNNLFRSISLALIGILLGVALGQGPKSDAAERKGATEAQQVTIDNFSFAPAALEIGAGTTVTWINKDDVPHTVVSTNNGFKHSPVLDTDDRFSTVFSTPGTYEYYCSIHPKMVGKIIVK